MEQIQLDLALPETPPASAPEPPKSPEPKISFGWEQFSAVIDTARPLLVEHWKEIALHRDTIQLDPDWDRYLAMERMGQLFIWTARTDEGTLVGYIAWIVTPALHYVSTLWAITDIFWLHPAFREGWTGVKLFKSCLPVLRQGGVKVVDVRVKDSFSPDADGRGRVGKFLVRVLKFRPVETVYQLVL